MKNNYGFTLIELLAIVVILGVIIAVAAPNMTKQINKKEETDQTILDEKSKENYYCRSEEHTSELQSLSLIK